jgi:hypothetical protein
MSASKSLRASSPAWAALRDRMAIAARLREVADARGRDDAWLASQLRIDLARLSAIYGGIVPSSVERERIESFVAANEGG